MKEKTRYVLGFAFDKAADNVLLILKEKPAKQAGLFNGIGGKIEPGEAPLVAMVREFHEEVRNWRFPNEIWMPTKEWERFAWMGTDEWECYCYRAFNNAILTAEANENEKVYAIPVDEVRNYDEQAMPNIPWLVLMARDRKISGTIIQYKAGE